MHKRTKYSVIIWFCALLISACSIQTKGTLPYFPSEPVPTVSSAFQTVTSPVTHSPTQKSTITPPAKRPDPTEKAAEQSLSSAMKTLRTLQQTNIAYKSETGWLHTFVENSDAYYQYYQDHADDPGLEIDEDTQSAYFRFYPPHHWIEKWIELDGNGLTTGNLLFITYDQNRTPLYAFAERSGEQTISVEMALNQDGSIQELVSSSQKTNQSANRSVTELNDYLGKVNNHWKLNYVTTEELKTGQQDIFRLQIEDRTETKLDLSYFPEEVIGFLYTYEIDQKTGECMSFSEEAVGESGSLYFARSERTHQLELLKDLPTDVAEFYQSILVYTKP